MIERRYRRREPSVGHGVLNSGRLVSERRSIKLIAPPCRQRLLRRGVRVEAMISRLNRRLLPTADFFEHLLRGDLILRAVWL